MVIDRYILYCLEGIFLFLKTIRKFPYVIEICVLILLFLSPSCPFFLSSFLPYIFHSFMLRRDHIFTSLCNILK